MSEISRAVGQLIESIDQLDWQDERSERKCQILVQTSVHPPREEWEEHIVNEIVVRGAARSGALVFALAVLAGLRATVSVSTMRILQRIASDPIIDEEIRFYALLAVNDAGTNMSDIEMNVLLEILADLESRDTIPKAQREHAKRQMKVIETRFACLERWRAGKLIVPPEVVHAALHDSVFMELGYGSSQSSSLLARQMALSTVSPMWKFAHVRRSQGVRLCSIDVYAISPTEKWYALGSSWRLDKKGAPVEATRAYLGELLPFP